MAAPDSGQVTVFSGTAETAGVRLDPIVDIEWMTSVGTKARILETEPSVDKVINSPKSEVAPVDGAVHAAEQPGTACVEAGGIRQMRRKGGEMNSRRRRVLAEEACQRADWYLELAVDAIRWQERLGVLEQRVTESGLKLYELKVGGRPAETASDILFDRRGKGAEPSGLNQLTEANDRAVSELKEHLADAAERNHLDVPLREATRALQAAVDAVDAEPWPAFKPSIAKEFCDTLESLLRRIPDPTHVLASGETTLPKVSLSLDPKSLSADPVLRLRQINNFLQGKLESVQTSK